MLELQSINSGYIPQHKLKTNFLNYYQEYVRKNRNAATRPLETSLAAFKNFIEKEFISPSDITENLCEAFRDYLLKKYNGETPANYFMRFKRVLKVANRDGYFREHPAEEVVDRSNKNKRSTDRG